MSNFGKFFNNIYFSNPFSLRPIEKGEFQKQNQTMSLQTTIENREDPINCLPGDYPKTSLVDINNIVNSSVLSDVQIREQRERGDIVIEPFVEKNLGNNSYDVTIGEYYYRSPVSPFYLTNNPNEMEDFILQYDKNCRTILNPYDQENVNQYWGELQQAQLVSDELCEKLKIPQGSKIIWVRPGELILAHTQEFIGTVENFTTMMKTRSSMGRLGLNMCKCAGLGDIGYFNRFTMEISNFSNRIVPLVVGSRVAQIVFFSCGKTENTYSKNGSYQYSVNKQEVIENWKPDMMLPKYRM